MHITFIYVQRSNVYTLTIRTEVFLVFENSYRIRYQNAIRKLIIHSIDVNQFINVIEILSSMFPYMEFKDWTTQYHFLTSSPGLPEEALRFLSDYKEKVEKAKKLPEFWRVSEDFDVIFRFS